MKKSIDILIDELKEIAIEHNEALEAANPNKINRVRERAGNVFSEIMARGGVENVKRFLHEEDVLMKHIVATCLQADDRYVNDAKVAFKELLDVLPKKTAIQLDTAMSYMLLDMIKT